MNQETVDNLKREHSRAQWREDYAERTWRVYGLTNADLEKLQQKEAETEAAWKQWQAAAETMRNQNAANHRQAIAESMPLDDERKDQGEVDKAERRDQMAELQAQPLTAPQVDHPELFPAALADADGQQSLF